jgi:hypothetical protein
LGQKSTHQVIIVSCCFSDRNFGLLKYEQQLKQGLERTLHFSNAKQGSKESKKGYPANFTVFLPVTGKIQQLLSS